jgi:hypothetical protein
LEHIAVDDDLTFAQDLEIAHRPQRTPDESLDLVSPARLATSRSLALHAFG